MTAPQTAIPTDPHPDAVASVGAKRRIEGTYLWMIAPAAVLFTLMLTIPMLTGFFYTFTNYQGYGDWRFVGL